MVVLRRRQVATLRLIIFGCLMLGNGFHKKSQFWLKSEKNLKTFKKELCTQFIIMLTVAQIIQLKWSEWSTSSITKQV